MCSRSSRSARATSDDGTLKCCPRTRLNSKMFDLPSQQFMLGQNQTKQVSAEASLLFLLILVTFAMGLRLNENN